VSLSEPCTIVIVHAWVTYICRVCFVGEAESNTAHYWLLLITVFHIFTTMNYIQWYTTATSLVIYTYIYISIDCVHCTLGVMIYTLTISYSPCLLQLLLLLHLAFLLSSVFSQEDGFLYLRLTSSNLFLIQTNNSALSLSAFESTDSDAPHWQFAFCILSSCHVLVML